MNFVVFMHALSSLLAGWILIRYRIFGHTCQGSLKVYCFCKNPLVIRFTARAFRKLLSIYVFSSFPLGFEGRICERIVSVPDHCLSFYFK